MGAVWAVAPSPHLEREVPNPCACEQFVFANTAKFAARHDTSLASPSICWHNDGCGKSAETGDEPANEAGKPLLRFLAQARSQRMVSPCFVHAS